MKSKDMTSIRVLVADVAEGRRISKLALESEYSLTYAATLIEAQNILLRAKGTEKFDLIVVGIHFDESSMFQMIECIKSSSTIAETPILAIQAAKAETAILGKSIDKILNLMGASRLLVLDGLPQSIASKRLKEAAAQLIFSEINSTQEK